MCLASDMCVYLWVGTEAAKNLTGPPMIPLTKDLAFLSLENGRLTINLARGTLDGVLTAGMCQDHVDRGSLHCSLAAWSGGPNRTMNPAMFKFSMIVGLIYQ